MILQVAYMLAMRLLIAVVMVMAVVAALDWLWARHTWYERLRMSIRDIRDEHKESEGDPTIKAKLRQIRQARMRKRMMSEVPNATVVITNPTHYAVVLKYEKGMAAPIIEELPEKYHTPLGKWFNQGRDLSGGEWQKVALSRAFMRTDADILVLDEPTAAMDAGAEATVFEHFRSLTKGRIAILISHRFSTVRMADQIVVLQEGRIAEHGSHEELLRANGHYARLFELQARGYQ